MQFWQYHVPYKKDFLHKEEVFPAASYQYILYGMGLNPQLQHTMDAGENTFFEQKRYENQKIKEALGAMLPDTRALLAFYKK